MPFRRSRGLITAPQVPIADWSDTINKGLVGAWMLNEGAGSTVRDWSGRNNTGTIQSYAGSMWGASRFGKTLTFAGGSQAISVPNASAFNGLANFSHFAWIRTNNSSLQLIAEQNDLAGGTSWGLYINGGVLHAYSGITAPQDDSAGSGLADGNWHFVGFTRNANAQQRVLYIDGVAVASPSDTQGGVCSPGTSIFIGNRSNNGFPFIGSMALVSFQSRALSASEVRRRYTEPLAGLVAPRRRIISGSAAGTIYFFVWADPATASDLSAGSLLAAYPLSASSAATEALSGLGTSTAAPSDTSSASDSTTGSATATASTSDSTTPADATTGASQSSYSLADPVTPTDASSGSMQASGSVSDSATAADTLLPNLVSLLADITAATESLGMSGTHSYTAALSDLQTFSDAFSKVVPQVLFNQTRPAGTTPTPYVGPQAAPSDPAALRLFVLRELNKLSQSVSSLIVLSPQAANKAPANPVENMIRFSKSPWRPLVGQTDDAWVTYVGGAWVAL